MLQRMGIEIDRFLREILQKANEFVPSEAGWQRDYEFARKYGLGIPPVPKFGCEGSSSAKRDRYLDHRTRLASTSRTSPPWSFRAGRAGTM